MLQKYFETIYICSQIKIVTGRRYNVRPDLDENTKPELAGLLYPEVTAGLFRAVVLDEMHFEVLNVLNKLQVADKQQIVKRTGFSNETLSKLLYECVAYGIACENIIQMNDGKKIELYIVDTGGIFALKESGINYRVLPYTSSIDERLKIYRRNIFLTNSETRGGNNTVKFLEEFANPEDFTITSPGVVLLFDSGICRRAGVTEEVEKIAAAIKEKNPSATFYDLAEEKIFSKRY